MTFLKMIADPVLLDETLALLGESLDMEKRWGGVAYMPERYADTVKEHVDSTKKTLTQIIIPCPHDSYTQEFVTFSHNMTDMHDVPEIYGELLLGGQEQALAQSGFDPYEIDARSFHFAFCHAENAVRNGTHEAFLVHASAVKSGIKQEKEARITSGADRFCLNLLGDMFYKLSKQLSDVPQIPVGARSNVLYAQHCFEAIENETARKNSFVGSVAKALEKNDSGTHMAKVYQDMLKKGGAEQVPYRYNQNSDLLKSCYREGAPLSDVLQAFPVSARDRSTQEYIAQKTVRFVYGTCQDYFKFGPEYLDLDDRDKDKQPNAASKKMEHEAYQRDLQERYETQDPQAPETHRVITKQDFMLRLEVNKQALCVVQTKERICIDPTHDNSTFWKEYAELKRQNWMLHTPY